MTVAVNLEVGLDLDRDGFACIETVAGDALNLVPTPVRLTLLDTDTTFTSPSASASKVNLVTRWGLKFWRVVMGTALNAGIDFGFDGTTRDDIPISASTQYTAKMWIRLQEAGPAVNYALQVFDQGGTSLASTTSITPTTSFAPLSLTFTTGVGDTFVSVRFRKNNDATDVTIDIVGLMVVAGSSAPTGFNAGDATNELDNVTTRTLSGQWAMGMAGSYDEVSQPARAMLVLDNYDGELSVENRSGTYFDQPNNRSYIRKDTLVYIQYQTTRTFLYIGKVVKLAPTPGTVGGNPPKTMTLQVECPMRRLLRGKYRPSFQESVAANAVIKEIFDRAILSWPYEGNYWVLDASELGTGTILHENIITTIPSAGIHTFAFAGDVTREKEISAQQVIRDYIAGEAGGRFFWDGRTGRFVFHNRHHDPLAEAPSGVLTKLVGYWIMESLSRFWLDSIGDNPLIQAGSPPLSVTGLIGNAGQFDASAKRLIDHVSNDTLQTGNLNFTIALWIKLQSKTANQIFMSKWDFTGGNEEFYIFYNLTTDRFQFRVQDAASDSLKLAEANNFGSPSTGTWYLLICEHDADNDQISISVNNGTANTTAMGTDGITKTDAPFRIGGYKDDSDTWYADAIIDEVGYYKALLTGPEKSDLYNSGAGMTYPFGASLVLHAGDIVAAQVVYADDVANVVQVGYNPRAVGTPSSVIYSADSVPFIVRSGESKNITARYFDASNPGQKIAAQNVIALAAGTDLIANSEEDGSGTNMTADIAFSAQIDATATKLVLNNTDTLHDAYITTLQIRGTPITQYAQETAIATDAQSIVDFGRNEYSVDIPAIDDSEYAEEVATRLLTRFKNPVQRYAAITISANQDSTMRTNAMTTTVGDVVVVIEPWTQHNRAYIVVGEQHRFVGGGDNQHDTTWILKPRDNDIMWILDTSALGVDTIPGF